jgi:predicted DNA-binding antitoxin AbrB/MazE fold protein
LKLPNARRVTTSRTIRAKFSNEVIEPLEKLDLEEGDEIKVTIIDLPKPSGKKDGLKGQLGVERD